MPLCVSFAVAAGVGGYGFHAVTTTPRSNGRKAPTANTNALFFDGGVFLFSVDAGVCFVFVSARTGLGFRAVNSVASWPGFSCRTEQHKSTDSKNTNTRLHVLATGRSKTNFEQLPRFVIEAS